MQNKIYEVSEARIRYKNAMCVDVFNEEQQEKADFIMGHPFSRLLNLSDNEIKKLAVAWCYYAGKIEGNAYSYVEAEVLLLDNITSEKKYEDAKMLKNLYNVFIHKVQYIQSGEKEKIDERTLLRIHSQLTAELVSDEDRGNYRSRPVRISGTEYIPPKSKEEILLQVNEILCKQEQINNPIARAIFVHCNIAKIQPFVDGNKRTSRLLESIIMMNNNLIPIYSTKDADILHYRKGLVHFYETGDFSQYADFFLDKQIERINQLVPNDQLKYLNEKKKQIKI